MKVLLCLLDFNSSSSSVGGDDHLLNCIESVYFLRTVDDSIRGDNFLICNDLMTDTLRYPNQQQLGKFDWNAVKLKEGFDLFLILTPNDEREGIHFIDENVLMISYNLVSEDSILLSPNSGLKLSWETLKGDGYNFNQLLNWFSNSNLKMTECDHLSILYSTTNNTLPPPLLSTLTLKSELFHSTPKIIKFTSTSEEPSEMYGLASEYLIRIIEPAFIPLLFKSIVRSTLREASQISQSQPSSRLCESQPYTPPSQISKSSLFLSQPSHSAPSLQESMKNENKTMLKKHLLLSLRQVGIDRHHEDFNLIWKHLYCGCTYALREDLSVKAISQNTIVKVIRQNINFLGLGASKG